MHKALYREYRPKKFEDVIGQEHIVRTLKNQIENNNLGHAYLFSGTRGTGKTSTAKIFSRAVNCTNRVDDEPCNECEICNLIINDNTMDIFEIDAASNNSVDDVRELRENVKYSPTNSKYKVYIIDEVHMLSQGAFNALLKTLEEPPSYVIFILATTEPHKIPATILSRCQRFDFKRVTVKDMTERMKYICEKEKVLFDEKSLNLIARNSQGAFRDALSILDQAISFSNNNIIYEDVVEILGTANIESLFDISQSIINQDTKETMKLIDEFIIWGKDIKNLVNDLVEHFRNIMICKISNDLEDIISYSEEVIEKLKSQSRYISMDEIIRIINILSKIQDNLKNTNNQRVLLEVNLMKLSQARFDESYEALFKRIEKLENIVQNKEFKIIEDIKDKEEIVETEKVTNEILKEIDENWSKIIDEFKKLGKDPGFSAVLFNKDKFFTLDNADDILYIVYKKDKDTFFEEVESRDYKKFKLIEKSIKNAIHKSFIVKIICEENLIAQKCSDNKALKDKGEEMLKNIVDETKLEIK